MGTDGSSPKKTPGRGAVCLWREVGLIPVGLTSTEVRRLLAMSHFHSSPTSARRLPFHWLLLSFHPADVHTHDKL